MLKPSGRSGQLPDVMIHGSPISSQLAKSSKLSGSQSTSNITGINAGLASLSTMAPQNAYNRMARDSSTDKVGTGKKFIAADALMKNATQPAAKAEPS